MPNRDNIDDLTQGKEQPVVIFDGVCNLCHFAVQFIIQRDPAGRFRFAQTQSKAGQALLKQHDLLADGLKTVVLLKNGKAHVRSAAALEIARDLSGLWPMLRIFRVIPAVIRDAIYNWIARNRYRWFGKQQQCLPPSRDNLQRFVDGGFVSNTAEQRP